MEKVHIKNNIAKFSFSRFGKYAGIVAAAVLCIFIGVSFWQSRSISPEDIAMTDAKVEREDCFLLLSGNDTLMAFRDIQGDTLFVGGKAKVIGEKSKDGYIRPSTYTYSVAGQWVNWLPVIPSCKGRLMVMKPDTASLCRASSKQLHDIVARQKALVKKQLLNIDEQEEHTDYYIRTHDVTESGFDVVTRASEYMHRSKDSLNVLSKALANIKNDMPLRLELCSRYFVWVNESEDASAKPVRVECDMVKEKNGMVVIRTKDSQKPYYLSTPLNTFNTEIIRQYLAKRQAAPKMVLPIHTRIDSIGTYIGTVDPLGEYNGYGKLFEKDGGYYEGYWLHGKRSGFGLALTPGVRMRIGEWKNDSYLGELITYTEERIYGIDISRYQHEKVVKVKKWVRNRKGKKVMRVRNKVQKFNINWNDLRITHLGTLSKKTISGDVNYKISFIYIKSTEGKSVKNNYYLVDYKAARAHGYKVGTYHFFSTKTTGAEQAMFFLKNSRYQYGDFPPVLDVEPTAGQIRQIGGTKAMFAHIRKWLNMVEQAYGVKPILYVSQTFVNKYLPAAPDLMKNYNVWIARYGMYRPNVNLVYWQLCPDGRVKGINTEVDINVFNGFQAEWERFCSN